MNGKLVIALLGIGLSALILTSCENETTRRIEGGQGPTPPTQLTARFVTATQVRLDWKDNAIGETGFDIFEATTVDSSYSKVATAEANAEFAYLEGRSSTQKYYYRVRAYNSEGVSAFSNIFTLEGGSMLSKMELEEGTMRCAAFSPNGEYVATGSGDYKVRIWDWATETEIRPFITHERAVLSISYSPGGGRLASSDDVQTVIWDLGSGQYYTSFIGTRAKYSPDGRFLIAEVESTTKLFDPTTFDVLHVLEGAGEDFCFSADGRWLVTGGDTLRKFDLNESVDTIRAVYNSVYYKDMEGDLHRFLNSRVNAISPDGAFALIGSAYLRLSDSTIVRTMEDFAGSCFAISPDGSKLVAGTIDWKIILWDVATGIKIKTLSGHEYSVYSVSWSPNGAFIVSASGDGTARVWGPF